MAIQNLNNLYSPGRMQQPRRTVKVPEGGGETVLSVETGDRIMDDAVKPVVAEPDNKEVLAKNTAADTQDESEPTLGMESQEILQEEDALPEGYFSRFKSAEQKEKEVKEADKPNVYQEIVSKSNRFVDPATGKDTRGLDEILAEAKAKYNAAGGGVKKNIPDTYVEPKAVGHYESPTSAKVAPILVTETVVKSSKVMERKPKIKPGTPASGKTVGQPAKNSKAAAKAQQPKPKGANGESPVLGKPNVTSRIQNGSSNASTQSIIVSRETSNVKQNSQKISKKTESNQKSPGSAAENTVSPKMKRVDGSVLKALLNNDEVSEIVVTKYNVVQVKGWDSGISDCSLTYESYDEFKKDVETYVEQNKVDVNWGALFCNKDLPDGSKLALFNKRGQNGKNEISVRIKKKRKVHYMSLGKLAKDGIQTIEMEAKEVECLGDKTSILIYGEDIIDNLTVLNAIASKISRQKVGAFISYEHELTYNRNNLEVFEILPSQYDEQTDFLEMLSKTGTEWAVFDRVDANNLPFIMKTLRSGSPTASLTCFNSKDLIGLFDGLGLPTTESRQRMNEFNGEDTKCLLIQVTKDESGKLMIKSVDVK